MLHAKSTSMTSSFILQILQHFNYLPEPFISARTERGDMVWQRKEWLYVPFMWVVWVLDTLNALPPSPLHGVKESGRWKMRLIDRKRINASELKQLWLPLSSRHTETFNNGLLSIFRHGRVVGLSIKYLITSSGMEAVLIFQTLLNFPLSELSQINMEVSVLDR